jgi:hypothetical protein
LGTSAVGRVLAGATVTPVADLPSTAVLNRLEDALEASGVEDAYAAWIRVDTVPVAQPVGAERMAEIERLWQGPAPVAPSASVDELPSDPRLRRAQRFDRFHARLIEASERLLSKREPEKLPLGATRRAEVPLGAASLRRYTAPSPISFGPSLRCRLPRGPRIPLTKRSLLAIFLVGTLLVAGALSYDVRQARADKQDEYLDDARGALHRADAAGSKEEALRHLEEARESLDEALDSGADAAVIAEWRDQAVQIEDRFGGINRLTGIVKLGTLPAELGTERSRLFIAGAQLYLVADKVFRVQETGSQLIQVLAPGEKVGRITVGQILNATVDGETLIVTDGKSLFQRDASGRWSAERLASSGREGWTGVASAFNGSFYLLNVTPAPTIRKFSADHLDDAPADWLDADEPTPALGHAVDMVVDGSIHVLADDGTIHTLHKGKERRAYSVDPIADGSKYVGIDGGSNGTYLYVLEVNKDNVRLLRYDRTQTETSAFLPLESDHLGFNAHATGALSAATDFVVDERAGIVYFVTADSVWQASLS